MNKLFSLIFVPFLCLPLWLNAQYFEQLYGSQNEEILTDGHNVFVGNIGHFLIGPSTQQAGSYESYMFNAQRTDIKGQAIPLAPYFNNRYYITEFVSGGIALNPDILVRDLKSYEFSNGNGFAVSGSFRDDSELSRFRVFHTRLNPDGTTPPPSPSGSNGTVYSNNTEYFSMYVVDVIESQFYPGVSYMCGYATEWWSWKISPFIIKIDETLPHPSFPIWSWAYDLDASNPDENSDQPFGIAENPNTGELVMVGRHSTPTDPGDGFVAKIDGATGALSGPVTYHGTLGTKETFTAIKTSANPAIGATGQNYVIGGHTNRTGDYDMWYLGMDASGTMQWSNTFDYMVGTVGNRDIDECNDLLERNNSGTYEYYLAGITHSPNTIDRVVVKADGTGNQINLGQFTYPKYEADFLCKIDMIEGQGAHIDGLSLFGSTSWHPGYSLGGWDFSLIKTYFNGYTACNQALATPQPVPYNYAPPYNSMGSNGNAFWASDFFVGIDDPLNEVNVCLETTVDDGSNSSPNDDELGVGINENTTSSAHLYPNYITSSISEIQLERIDAFSGKTDVSIVDANGRVVWQHGYTVANGQEVLKLDVSSINHKSGTYVVQARNADRVETYRLMVGSR